MLIKYSNIDKTLPYVPISVALNIEAPDSEVEVNKLKLLV